jgi:hypothetical protein
MKTLALIVLLVISAPVFSNTESMGSVRHIEPGLTITAVPPETESMPVWLAMILCGIPAFGVWYFILPVKRKRAFQQ